jgi:hypothetical protein
MDFRHRDLARHVMGSRVFVGGSDHLRIVDQPVDQDLPLGELERLDLDSEAAVDPVDQAIQPAPQEPAAARDQQPVEQRPQRERQDRDEQPERNGDRLAHFRPSRPSRAVRVSIA